MERVWRKGNPLTLLVGMQAGMDFPDSSVGKESACSVGDLGLLPGLGRSPEEGKGYPSIILAWKIPCTVHGVTELDMTERLSLSLHFSQPLWRTV